jgi:hypothetical protein
MKKYKITANYRGKQVVEYMECTSPAQINEVYTADFGYRNLNISEVSLDSMEESSTAIPVKDDRIPTPDVSEADIMAMAIRANGTPPPIIGQPKGSETIVLPSVKSQMNTTPFSSTPGTPQASIPAYNTAPTPAQHHGTFLEYQVGEDTLRFNTQLNSMQKLSWVKIEDLSDISQHEIGFKYTKTGSDKNVVTDMKGFSMYIRKWESMTSLEETTNEDDA